MQYAVIVGLIQFVLHLWQIPDFSISWAAKPWVLRVQALCLELVFTPVSYLQLELQLACLVSTPILLLTPGRVSISPGERKLTINKGGGEEEKTKHGLKQNVRSRGLAQFMHLVRIYVCHVWRSRELSENPFTANKDADILLYTHIHADVSRSIRTISMNETNTLLYNNIPLTLYSKGLMFLVCERWVGDGGRLIHIDPKFLWT